MAKLQTKSDNIKPFGGLFPIFKTFDKSGVRNVIDRTLGPRGTLLAFSYGDIFASLLGCYLTGGASERNFDCLNNDFGWAHLPFSFLNENTVFMIAAAILKNFHLYFLGVLRGRAEGVDCGTRIKRFVRKDQN